MRRTFLFKGCFAIEGVFGDEQDYEWDENAGENGDKTKCPSPRPIFKLVVVREGDVHSISDYTGKNWCQEGNSKH